MIIPCLAAVTTSVARLADETYLPDFTTDLAGGLVVSILLLSLAWKAATCVPSRRVAAIAKVGARMIPNMRGWYDSLMRRQDAADEAAK